MKGEERIFIDLQGNVSLSFSLL